MYVCVHVYMCMSMCACACVLVYMCMYVYAYTHICVYIYDAYLYMHMYRNAHIERPVDVSSGLWNTMSLPNKQKQKKSPVHMTMQDECD